MFRDIETVLCIECILKQVSQIENVGDFVQLAVRIMEHYERFVDLDGYTKRVKVTNVLTLAVEKFVPDMEQEFYKSMIPAVISSVVYMTKHKTIINKVKGRLLSCFNIKK